MNARVQVMVDSRELEPLSASDEEVAGRWRRAVETYHDSRKGLTAASAVTLRYQAGLQAATTLVRAGGYRVRAAASGHHRLTFEALRALEIREISPLGREMNDLRRRRHHAVYEWDDDPEGETGSGLDPDRLDEIVRALLRLGHAYLREQRPAIVAELDRLPPET